MISFLHAADLHLGLRITRFAKEVTNRIREARFQALEKVRELAKSKQVHFVIIAGDLFDDHAVDADLARRAFDLLESFPCRVFILSGNHDPLLPGAVWDRPPWNQPEPKRVHVLRDARPVSVDSAATLFPCPVLRKTSLNDPTRWIGEAARDDSTIRVGIAHGSLRTREDLPADDHLIARQAAQELKLDYLALGHWHRRQIFRDPDGVERTAYCGVHEPIGFPGATEYRIGWLPYSSGKLSEFLDSGTGEILHVQIDRPGAPPAINAIEVRHLIWADEAHTLSTEAELARLIDEIATRPETERRLLRLKLTGILDAGAMARLDHLREVLQRYLLGEVDQKDLHIQPTEDEIHAVAGQGVLRRVLETLRQEARTQENGANLVAERAMLLLYQIAREVSA
ncbi:MAG TPA: DNA repair exonuclease [Gemmataceae bacterium]|jgi:DNA repair exonuclease SbcCD nuclease subunit|nr:DNA repair exonuclease [Gemmataceae bacterium]